MSTTPNNPDDSRERELTARFAEDRAKHTAKQTTTVESQNDWQRGDRNGSDHGTPASVADDTGKSHDLWVLVPAGTTDTMFSGKDIVSVTYRFDEYNAAAFLVHESIMTNDGYRQALDDMVFAAYPEFLPKGDRPKARPQITVTGLQLGEQTEQTLKALYSLNNPPKLFVRSGEIIRIRPDEKGRPIVEKVMDSHLRMYMTESADFYRAAGKRDVAIAPPTQVAKNILAFERWEFPSLMSLVEIPVLRPDGSIVDQAGYDSATGVYYWPDGNLTVPAIPEAPTGHDICEAVKLIDETIGEFPYVDQASRANAVALLLTPLVRQAIKGAVPIGLIDAVNQGTGKSLLSDVISLIPTGRAAAMMTMPGNEEEWRKRITSALYEGAALMFIDNIAGRLASPTLASAVTARTWKDRWLGVNRTVEVPNRATWIGNGNNIQLGGDMQRRAFWIRMDAKSSTPWIGRKFTHPDLIPWVTENRGRLIAAFLTLVRAWYAAGCPASGVKPLGSFEEWTYIVTGVLAYAGIHGCLENLQEMYDTADEESAEWERFLRALGGHYGDRSFRVAEAVADAIPKLADVLPEELASVWNTPENRSGFSRKLGNALRFRENRRYGAEHYRITREGIEHSAITWLVEHD